jgi:hypothetical protein
VIVPGVNTDLITESGMAAGDEHLSQLRPDLSVELRELILNMVRSDWSHGNEELALKELLHWVDMTGAYRVIAAMKSASDEGEKP